MREENDYIINVETLLILPYGKGRSIVYEIDETLIINLDILQIIKNSCLFFGSSLEGRKDGTKYLINCEMKVPIIVEDSKLIIFFPTSSYRGNNCIWISYNNLLKYSKLDNKHTSLFFKDNKKVDIEVKYNIIDNQIVRCIKLESIYSKRKNVSIESENI